MQKHSFLILIYRYEMIVWWFLYMGLLGTVGNEVRCFGIQNSGRQRRL